MLFAKIQLTPRGCLIVGIVLVLMCMLELVIVICQPRSLLCVHDGASTEGVRQCHVLAAPHGVWRSGLLAWFLFPTVTWEFFRVHECCRYCSEHSGWCSSPEFMILGYEDEQVWCDACKVVGE
jgi:hypothetical protein